MRLIDRADTSLAVALVASALVMFQRPLRVVIDSARFVEQRYGLDLLPGLTVLVGAFAFHQYRKRQQAKAAVAAAEADVLLERARSADLEKLVALGRALGGALEPAAVAHVFWRHMPALVRDRDLWMVTRTAEIWDPVNRDASALHALSAESIEAMVAEVMKPGVAESKGGALVEGYCCYPMIVGETVVGVIGVRNAPPMPPSEQNAVCAAVALLAIAIRNGQLLAQTRESSIRDSLTGCFNRAHALDTLSAELRRSVRTGRPMSIMMIDIDEFKTVNDEFGHLAGDAMLAAVGSRLGAVLRASDVKCRWGGDEFLVLLPDTPLAGAEHVAAAVTSAMADLTVAAADRRITPTLSLGLASSSPGEIDPMMVIARADQALYRAKREGRNRFAAAPLAPAV